MLPLAKLVKTMQKILFCLLVAVAVTTFAEEAIIAESGRSDYRVVVPDNIDDQMLERYITLAGEVICTAVRKASGADLPLLRESAQSSDTPTIYVGNTKALAAAGFSSADFAPWEHSIAVRGRDIFVYGLDQKNPLLSTRYPTYFVHFVTGSLKAACVFVEKFANTRFVGRSHNNYGEHDGVRTLPQDRIAVPGNFVYRDAPRFRISQGDAGGILYSVANNFLFYCGHGFSCHSHGVAIPQDKYYPEHPEYFALIAGQRLYHKGDSIYAARPQYCLSNPDVQELIYQEALSRANAGANPVELGQSDGFLPCECDKCQAWYGTPIWSEKLWCFHRDLAARLYNERPGTQVSIMCYGPTHNTPESFSHFPTPNVMIDVAPAEKELLKKWAAFNLTGMVAWTYYFGSYHPCGYSPEHSFATLKSKLQQMRQSKVTALYNCGIFSIPALGGPWYYAFGRWLGEPDHPADEILQEYCRFAFGEEAAPYFVEFFQRIDARLEKFPIFGSEDFNDFDSSHRKQQNAIELWQSRYPAEELRALEHLFAAGAKHCHPAEPMLDSLKQEFGYLRHSAELCNAKLSFDAHPSEETTARMVKALEARNDFIAALPPVTDNPQLVDGKRYFNFARFAHLQSGGSMSGVFGGVFALDPQLLKSARRNGVAVSVRNFSDLAWSQAQRWEFRPFRSEWQNSGAQFQVGYNPQGLLFRMSAPLPTDADTTPVGRDGKAWERPAFEILLSPGVGHEGRHYIFNPAPDSCYDARMIPDEKKFHEDVKWNGSWHYISKMANGLWIAEATIPFADFEVTPKQGDRWKLQAGFSAPHLGNHGWNISLDGAFASLDGFGDLQLGAHDKTAEYEHHDLSASFARIGRNGAPEGWFGWPAGVSKPVPCTSGETPALRLPGDANAVVAARTTRIFPLTTAAAVATLKVQARGHGIIQLAAILSNHEGGWLVNRFAGKAELSPELQEYIFSFSSGIDHLRGATGFSAGIFLQPDGEAIVESVELDILHADH